MSRPVSYELLQEDSHSHARRGQLHTQHGVVQTPVFMPVGTLGTVKSLDAADMELLGARMMLANAYHMMLRATAERVDNLGGLHRFMGYDGAILTDSGGYQVFSLSQTRKLNDEGVTFQSHVDGATVHLSPEKLVRVQELLAPDIAMVLDECPPAMACRATVERAVTRTPAWAKRCIEARRRDDVGWFGIVQGALYEDLRAQHACALSALPFDGFAIGGVSVGEAAADITRIVRHTAPLLPRHKPRYLMGVGTPGDLVRGVASGIDMFDCVMPSRNARNGQLFTMRGKLNIKNAVHRDAAGPIDEDCQCRTCRTHSRAFLRHLFMTGELSYFRLATIHNLSVYLNLMATMRSQIESATFHPEVLLAQLGEADAASRISCG